MGEWMTIKAPPSAGRSLDARKRSGDHLTNVQPPQRSKEEIRRKAREFAEFRRRQAQEQAMTPVHPTPERVAKESHGMAVADVPQGRGAPALRAYRTKPPVEQYRGQWGDHAEIAFALFIRDAEALDNVRVTINYDGNGGAAPGSRWGGLPQDSLREASERYLYVRERLPAKFQRVCDWLVLQVRSEASGRTVSWVDVGHRLMPSIRDRAMAKGISMGALLMTGELLAFYYRRYAVLSSDGDRPNIKLIRGE